MTAERDVFQEAIASLCLLWTQGPRGLGRHLSSHLTVEKDHSTSLSESAERKGGFLTISLFFCSFKKLFF